MKDICQDTILGRFVDYRKKRSYNRVIETHYGPKAYCPKIHLTSLIKVDFQSRLQILFHVFRHWTADVKKKHQSH